MAAIVSSADPDDLDQYVRTMGHANRAANDTLAAVAGAVETWNAAATDFGGKVDGAVLQAIDTAVNELSYLDLWVGRVAGAFRDADVIVGPPSLRAAVAQGVFANLVTVVRDAAGGTRVVRLNVDRLPQGMTLLEWQLMLEAFGLTGASGPLHVVIHGWGTTTKGATVAGEQAADMYDQERVKGATVLVVDWDAKHGAGGLWPWQVPGDFDAAERQATRTGDALAPMLTAMAKSNPDARVAVTAHSLGNHVAMRALTEMADPTHEFEVDYTAIQPAVPDDAPIHDRDKYGAVLTDGVRTFTLTIDNDDEVLFWYELTGPQALGDEASDSPEIRDLIDTRALAGLSTILVDHDDPTGGGHLGLAPGVTDSLVHHLYEEQVDRSAGRPAHR